MGERADVSESVVRMAEDGPVYVTSLAEMKRRGEKIVVVTAYDTPSARCAEEAGVDVLLVGDSVGDVVLGYENTLPVTMEVMVHHVSAVARGRRRCLLVADMPFLSYQCDTPSAVRNAGRFLQEAGAQAVKLEGGSPFRAQLEAIIAAGIPVMGHLGYTPQSVHAFGRKQVRGRLLEEARSLYREAKFLEEVGCFSLVLECVPAELARVITEAVRIPTIGIGSGPHCDGQVLVLHDLIGLWFEQPFKHVKQYANVREVVVSALRDYSREVRESVFPAEEHSFRASDYEALTREQLEGAG